jgi:hypothetical protein
MSGLEVYRLTCPRCGSTEWSLLSSKTISVEPGSEADDFVCDVCLLPISEGEQRVKSDVTLSGEEA